MFDIVRISCYKSKMIQAWAVSKKDTCQDEVGGFIPS